MSKRAKPVPRSSRVQALTDKTRATTLRRDKDDVKNVSVTLMAVSYTHLRAHET